MFILELLVVFASKVWRETDCIENFCDLLSKHASGAVSITSTAKYTALFAQKFGSERVANIDKIYLTIAI